MPVPAPPNYPLRYPKYHLIETMRPLIEVHWGSRYMRLLFGSPHWHADRRPGAKGRGQIVLCLNGAISVDGRNPHSGPRLLHSLRTQEFCYGIVILGPPCLFDYMPKPQAGREGAFAYQAPGRPGPTRGQHTTVLTVTRRYSGRRLEFCIPKRA